MRKVWEGKSGVSTGDRARSVEEQVPRVSHGEVLRWCGVNILGIIRRLFEI